MAKYTREPLPWPEEWRPVPSKPGLQASSWGRVLLPQLELPGFNGSVRRTKPQPRWGLVKQSRRGGSYLYLGLRTALYGNIKVHQCVCEAWHGPKPFPDALVLHEDEDALNNVQQNLKWGTHVENMNYPGYKQALRERALLYGFGGAKC